MKLAATILLAGLIGVGAWFWLRPEEPQDFAPLDRNAEFGVDVERRESTELIGTVTEDASPLAAEATAVREDLGEAAAEIDTGDALTISIPVVDGETGERLPLARVRVLDLGFADFDLIEHELGRGLEMEDIVRRHGRREIADEDGLLTLAWSGTTCWLRGTHEGRQGWMEFDSETGAPEAFALRQNGPLVVRVVDNEDRPVSGIRMRLVVGRNENAELGLEATTRGGSGEASWPSIRRNAGWGTPGFVIEIRTAEPWLETQSIELEEFPAEPVVFELKPFGSLEVELTNSSGQREPRDGWVGLRRTGATTRMKNGLAQLRFVQIGRHLDVRVEVDHIGGELSWRGAGFTHQTKTKRVQVELGAEPLISGKLILEDGMPFAERPVTAYVSAGDDSYYEELISGPEGEFAVRMRASESVSAGALELRSSGPLEPERGARVPMPPVLVGNHDVGLIVIEPIPILAAGIVLDADGQPVEGLTVQVSRDGSSALPDHRGDQAEARTKADGSFSIRAIHRDADELFLVSDASWILPNARGRLGFQPFGFTPGASNLVITCDAPGSISASVVAEERWRRSLYGILRPDGRGMDHTGFQQPDQDGKIHWSEVQPGNYEFILFSALAGQLLAVPDVIVTAGVETRDSRMMNIDLLEMFTPIELTVRTPEGTATGAMAYIGAEFAGRASADKNGRLLLLASKDGVDVRVVAPGYRVTELKGVTKDREVMLEPGIEVTLRLTGDVSLSELPPEFRPQFGGSNRESMDPVVEPGFAETGQTTARFSLPGSYPLRWAWVGQSGAGAWQQIRVPEIGSPVIDLELTREAFESFGIGD